MAKFDCKEYAKQMRENCYKDENGNIICSAELWEHIASIIESSADVVPKSEEVERVSASFKFALLEGMERGEKLVAEHDRELAREIFEEIDRIVSEYCDRFIPPTEMVAMLFDLKKKYAESEGKE